jgi:putative hydrolase of the HAD superfamily
MGRAAPLRAITFDFWNTLYWGRGVKFAEVRRVRLDALGVALEAAGVQPQEAQLESAYVSGLRETEEARVRGRHFGSREFVTFVLEALGTVSPDEEVGRAALRIEEAGALAPLVLLPGAAEALPALARAGVRLGLISDTGTTPGRILMRYLVRDGLLDCFSSYVFSDETGTTKPDPVMFLRALTSLGVGPGDAGHVGDLPGADVAGAQSVGMLAIRFAGAEDRAEPPPADMVIRDHRDLLELIEVCPSHRCRY